MVKHNNQIPNIHCKKKYCESSRGPLKVKLRLNQATAKKARRIRRAAKAAAVAPAPVQKLRPVVHCPTQKYSAKVRLGKGFTLEELKAAGFHPSYARTVGIAVDFRRRNRSEESLALNLKRLQEYKSKLVILKKGDATPDARIAGSTTIQPIVKKAASEIVMETVTPAMKEFTAYTAMRVARQETRVAGYRISVEQRKKKE
jgi:large subunit ribosomal protein L13e